MQVTIAAASRATITDRRSNGVPATRKALAVYLVSGDASWGWNSDVDISTDGTAGIPLTIGSPLFLGSELAAFSAPLYIYSTAGAVVRYQELLIP